MLSVLQRLSNPKGVCPSLAGLRLDTLVYISDAASASKRSISRRVYRLPTPRLPIAFSIQKRHSVNNDMPSQIAPEAAANSTPSDLSPPGSNDQVSAARILSISGANAEAVSLTSESDKTAASKSR